MAKDDFYDGHVTREVADLAQLNDLNRLRYGEAVTLAINHRGRVQTWRLRDGLRADRGREQFGILFDRRA